MLSLLIPLLNLLLPLLFIASFILFVYSIVLFINGISKKSKELKRKAIKVGVVPLLYIITILIYAYFTRP